MALVFVLLCASTGLTASATARGATVQTLTLGTPGVPFAFVEPLDPLFTLGDGSDERLAFITPLLTVPVRDVMARTPWMNLGAQGVDKEFRRLAWTADSDPGASFEVSYSIGGGVWLIAQGDGGYAFPDGSHGKAIAVRVKMSSTDADATARFDDISISWVKWTRHRVKPADDVHDPGAGHDSGSGVYVYPTAAPSAQASARAGGGSTYSAGSRASGGVGGGHESGAGSAESGAVATGTGPEVLEAAPVRQVPAPPVESTGEGAQVPVTGVLVDQGEQVVTGVPYRSSAGVEPAGGGASLGGSKRGLGVSRLLIGATAGIVITLLFGPWLFTAASLRELTGFSSRRVRSS